jgi:hypothetical protein
MLGNAYGIFVGNSEGRRWDDDDDDDDDVGWVRRLRL